jgi:hypothetical protein
VSFSVEKKIRWVEFFILLILILLGLFFGIGMQVPFFERAMVSSNPHYRFIYAIAIPLGALVAMLCKYKTPLMDGKKTALVFFLLTLPFVYTYGTGIPGGMVFPRLVVFWHMGLLALIMVFYREQIQFRNLFGVFCLLFAFTAAQINYGQWHPFRQKQSLVLQSKMICLPTTEKGLIVDDDVYAYVSTLQSIAFGAGFNVGEPLLDMTGNMPAAALFLGAATPGARRFYSNYPFSKSNTKNILSQVDNEILANAWLLIVDEPNEYEYDLAFLQQCDIFVDRDYEKVGSMLAPTYTHDMTPRRHFLFKPLKQNQDSEE